MINHYELASRFNDAGDLDQAATHFALAAFELMVTKKFEYTKTLSLGAAEFLRAISCDVRVNNTDRAAHLFDFTKVLLERVRADTNDKILEGLTYEWVGDGYLMLGDQRAMECYEVASGKFTDVKPAHGWGAEEEFDNALWAFQDYIEARGYELTKEPYGERPEIDFQNRVEEKIVITDELLNRR